MAVFILFSITDSKYVLGFSKDEVTSTGPEANRKEKPSIKRHGNKHEYVSITNLHHMKQGLYYVHTETNGEGLYPVNSVCA